MRRQNIPAVAAIVVSLATPAIAIAASNSGADPAQSTRTERAAFVALSERRTARLRSSYHHRLQLVARATSLTRTRARLAGEHRPATRRYQRRLAHWTTPRVRAHVAVLRHRVRTLRQTGGAPAVAIPPQLRAIAACESGGNPRAVSASGSFRGLFQFDYGTWASVGGHGDPAAAPAQEQYRRAAVLYARAGSSPWPVCGR